MNRACAFGRGSLGRVLLLICLGWSTWVQAGTFAVAPVRATLSATLSVSSLTVRNDGQEPAVVQLELLSWTQQDGKDVYTSTRDLLATPPIFTVPAGGSQVVRVGLRRPPDAQQELAYRLYLQEVPSPPNPGFQGLQVALRIGLPVFVLPAAAPKPALRWQARRTADGDLRLSLANDGNVHVQVANFSVALPGRPQPLRQQVAAYVLPGHSRDWIVKTDAVPQPGATLRFYAQTDGGDVDIEVVVEP